MAKRPPPEDVTAPFDRIDRMDKGGRGDASDNLGRPREALVREAATLVPDGFDEPPGFDLPVLDEDFASRYRALTLLGEGGMGAVRLSRDGVIGREVAMKVIRPEVAAHAERQERFVREARIQGQLEHPAIVPVYDLGHDPSGALFFTMKRVRGLTLQEIVERLRSGDPVAAQRYSRRRLLTAFASVCLAVDFAHTRGVIHRDLKPDNVMLGDFGEVYLLDWGLARPITSARTAQVGEDVATGLDGPARFGDSDARTAHGVMLGTPGYMPPEQIRGDHDRLDARSDVYALGAMLFELLAWEPVNPGRMVIESVAHTMSGVDARLRQRAPARDVPPELEAICVKATEFDPRDRHPTARALHDEIERFLDGDRDVERRRELASVHSLAAARGADEAQRSSGQSALLARRGAMRDVGRALAFDPDNGDALRTMMRLLTDPPREVPPEVEREMQAVDDATRRVATRFGAVAYVAILGFIPLALQMGVRDWTRGLIGVALFIASAISAWLVSRRPGSRPPLALVLLGTLAITATSQVFGPFVVLPGLAAIHGMGFVIYEGRRARLLILCLASVPILLPALLEWTGLIPPSEVFANGAITILPRVLSLPPWPTRVLLLLTSLSEVVIACLLVARVRGAQRVVERRLQLTLWQLRQMVPDEARPPAPTSATS